MKSIVLPVVLVIALTGAVSAQTKMKQSGHRNRNPLLHTLDAGFVSIEGVLKLVEGSLAVESENATYLVRLPEFGANPGDALGDCFSEGSRVLLEGLREGPGGAADKVVLKPARLRRLDS